MERNSQELNVDLLEGVSAIADFLGMKPRRVFYLAEHRALPLFKIGHRWCARKSTLRAHIEKLEAGKTADDEAA